MKASVRRSGLPLLILFCLGFCILLDVGDNSPRPFATAFPRTASYAIEDGDRTALGQAVAPLAKMHDGQSGFELILKDAEALRMRLAMIEAAERSIDIQYYSIEDDSTDELLIEELVKAAARGVRIRILTDDITLKKSDRIWALLNKTPHVELRIFNPFATRGESLLSRTANFFIGLARFSKRMHNKLFIADNELAIIGGRNLGNAYFGTNEDFNFRDVDILAAGPVIASCSQSFDSFWNGKEAYPFYAVGSAALDEASARRLLATLAAGWKSALAKDGTLSLVPLAQQLSGGKVQLVWANASLAADAPDKVDNSRQQVKSIPATSLKSLLGGAKSQFIVVSPYLIPGVGGMGILKDLISRGVKVRILTNSLGSTDVVAVHTAYKRYRQPILLAGAELYELKPQPGKYPRPGRFSSSSRASLHTKAYVIDSRFIVIGTFNLDPRSIDLNTEIALVIDSPELAIQLVNMFDRVTMPATSFRVVLNKTAAASPRIEWIAEDKDKKEVRYDSEPEAGFWRTVKADMLSLIHWEQEL